MVDPASPNAGSGRGHGTGPGRGPGAGRGAGSGTRPGGSGDRAPLAPLKDDARANAALRHMLAKLRAPAAAASVRRRPLTGRPPLGLLSAIMEEIDETVMARTLVLRNAEGRQVHLGVCNRRLLHAGVPGDGTARNLTYAGGGDLAALRATLQSFCAPGGLTVEAAPASGSATLEQTGVAVATLRDAWEGGAPSVDPDAAPAGAPPGAPAAPRPATLASPPHHAPPSVPAGTPPGAPAAPPGPNDARAAPSPEAAAPDPAAPGSAAPELAPPGSIVPGFRAPGGTGATADAAWSRIRTFCGACDGAGDTEAILAVALWGETLRYGEAGALSAALDGPGAALLKGLEGAVLLEAGRDDPALLLAAHGPARAILRLRPGRGAAALARWVESFGAS